MVSLTISWKQRPLAASAASRTSGSARSGCKRKSRSRFTRPAPRQSVFARISRHWSRRSRRSSLLHFELCVDHVFLTLVGAAGGAGGAVTGWCRPAARARLSRAPLHVLCERCGRRFEVAHRLLDRLYVLGAGSLLGPLDGRAHRRLVGVAQLRLMLL